MLHFRTRQQDDPPRCGIEGMARAKLDRNSNVGEARSAGAGTAHGSEADNSQIRAVLSPLAVVTRAPSGLNAANHTTRSCRRGAPTGNPVAASQTLAVLSLLTVTIREPSGLNRAR